MLRLAADMSRATGRTDEAETLLARSRELADEPPPQLPADDDLADDDLLDDETIRLQEARKELAKGMALLNVDPRAALAKFERLPAEFTESTAAGHLRLVVGRAHLELGDRSAARAAFEQCLADGGPHQSELEQQCHRFLAEICIAERRYEEAHDHLAARVRAMESVRASFRDVEGRMRFLRLRQVAREQCVQIVLVPPRILLARQIEAGDRQAGRGRGPLPGQGAGPLLVHPHTPPAQLFTEHFGLLGTHRRQDVIVCGTKGCLPVSYQVDARHQPRPRSIACRHRDSR